MKITEEAREEIQAALNARGGALWVKLVSEVHGFGDEGVFFVLVDGPGKIPPIYELFRDVFRQPLERFNETAFTVSFWEKRDGLRLLHEVIEDEEWRSGRLRWAIGSGEPDVEPLRDADVFGVNEGVPRAGER